MASRRGHCRIADRAVPVSIAAAAGKTTVGARGVERLHAFFHGS
jgi:hypothetical protein